jgi:hypothetical protein
MQVYIAKQYSPFGFHVTLEAPTAQWVRKEEDRCTYLNKVCRLSGSLLTSVFDPMIRIQAKDGLCQNYFFKEL